MEVILIMWPLMALIGAMVIGKQKGRTGEGLMVCLLLGPLGWLCIYLGIRQQAATRQNSKMPGDHKVRAVLCCGVFMLGLAPFCCANLGDTPAQIRERYGQPTEKFGDTGPKIFRFHRPGAETDTIDVRFQNGKSAEEIYFHWKSKTLEERDETGSFSQKDTDAFLKANAQGLTWREQPPKFEGLTTWFLGSNNPAIAVAKAVRDDEEHGLRVVSQMFDESLTPDASTAAELDALFPQAQPRKSVAKHSPIPLKPDLLPVLKMLGQPQSVVNRLLGNPTQHLPIHEPEKRAGGTTYQYPDGTNSLSLMVDFYRNQAVWISLNFSEPYPASEQELFEVLGLPKSSFQKTFEDRANTGYRGTINKRVIEMLAMHQGRDGGFCHAVNVELVASLD